MYPKLLEYQNITIFTYAFCIVTGTLLAVFYTKWQFKKTLKISVSNNFFYLIFITGFVGGKIFLFFEKPLFYINNPNKFLDVFSGGFVFYGSFVCIIAVTYWYLRKNKMPILTSLDILAITTTIVHAIGRLGCFFSGCCYGKETNTIFGMVFPATENIAVHPTQLYEVFSILLIMTMLFFIKQKKQFNGQVILSYIILYAVVRGFLEIYRGDNRGFIIQDVISHSQLIAFLLISITTLYYIKLNQKEINPKN